MTWKSIILIILGLGLIGFAIEHSWIFGAGVAGFAVLLWLAWKLDKAMGIR